MKVLVAGASGAVGRRLVPLLAAGGHDVVATTRSAGKFRLLRELGATPAVLDVLDPDAVRELVTRERPDAMVHQATALSDIGVSIRRLAREFEQTNRLRTSGTDNLLAAARDAGVGRFVAQSFAGWPYQPVGGMVKSEDDPLDPSPPKPMRPLLDAIKHLESAVTEADWLDGVVLRYGGFYGPGTSIAPGGVHYEAVKRRRFPIAGPGTGVWSFVHVDDVATATRAAIEGGAPGIYNIVDDDPAPVSVWLPVLAEAIGAKPPRHVPLWLGRLAGGDAAVAMMTRLRGASNAKAKARLGWRPRWESWREGFHAGLTEPSETMNGWRPATSAPAGSRPTSSTAQSPGSRASA